MRHLIRTWIAMAVFGAGLIHLAVAAASPLPALIAFVAVGVGELVWAVLTLSRGLYALPVASPLLALAPIAVWAASVAAGVDSAAMPPLALGAATLLDLAATAAVVLERRRGSVSDAASPPRTGRLLLGFMAGAFAMVAVTLPALGQTTAGIAASEGPHSHRPPGLEIEVDHAGH